MRSAGLAAGGLGCNHVKTLCRCLPCAREQLKELDVQRKTQQRLNRGLIARGALDLIDREGLVGLSMRRLGSSLGVEGMALYRHFPEKEAILDEVVALVLEDLALPGVSRGWQDQVRTVALSLRERLLLHPNAMPLVAARWLNTPGLRALLRDTMQLMISEGMDEASAYSVVHAVTSFVLGHSWLGVGGFVGEMPEAGGLTRQPVPPRSAKPGVAGADAELAEFERGLDLLLRGAQGALSGAPQSM